MKILVVRVGRVGDTVMMTPALSEIIQYYPDAKITLLTSPVGKHLLNNFHPNITDIWSWQRSGIFKPYIDKYNIRKQLKKAAFDKFFVSTPAHALQDFFLKLQVIFIGKIHRPLPS